MLVPEQRWETIEGQLNEGQEHTVWVDQKSGHLIGQNPHYRNGLILRR